MVMNPSGMEKSDPPLPISSVREAADEMGVSERTIYRMLRSGRLVREKSRVRSIRNVNNVSDIHCQNDNDEIHNHTSVMSKTSIMSDKMTLSILEMLTTSLRDKDDQIEQLIVNQREMNQTIQRLQEQMFELARLVLSQNAAVPVRAPEPTPVQEPEKSAD